MAYRFTFTNRFQKHYKTLTSHEKTQLRIKLNGGENVAAVRDRRMVVLSFY